MGSGTSAIIAITVIVVVAFTTLILILSRYRKCPADQIMVIYGKVGLNADGSTASAKCIHGGAAFIWPVIQSFEKNCINPIYKQVGNLNERFSSSYM